MSLTTKTIRFISTTSFLLALILSSTLLCFFLAYNNRDITSTSLILKRTHSPSNYNFGSTPPISLGSLSYSNESYINLRLNFYILNLDGHQDIFQTAPGNEGIRIEISGTTAALVLSDKSVTGGVIGLIIDSGIATNQWYELQVVAKNGISISSFLNGKQVVDYKSSGIELSGSEVLIGQGFDSSRNFHGFINNITLEEGAYERNITWGENFHSNYVLPLLFTLCILSILLKLHDPLNNPLSIHESLRVKSVINGLILLYIIFYFIRILIPEDTQGYIKWGFLIVIALSYPLYEFSRTGTLITSSFYKFIFIFFLTLYNFYLIKNNLIFFKSHFFILLTFLSVNYFALLISIFIKKIRNVISIFYSFSFILLLMQTFNLISQLSNWTLLTDNYITLPTYSTLLIFISISLITYLVYNDVFKASQFNIRNNTRNAINLTIDSATISFFLLFSFRHDSLFISTISGSPIYHWEYYVGAIRSIQNGGWLLWDTPSQYGFLNLAIASIFSPKNPYQSFYLFQGFLLFTTSTGLYLSISNCFSLSNFHKIFLFLLIFFSFFFADIEFIGPYPFPSSSVVRFFGAYLLIIIFCLFPKFRNNQIYLVSLIFPFTFFWSAESAVYCISIILFVLTSLFIKLKRDRHLLTFFYTYILYLTTAFVFSSTLILMFYKFNTGFTPDFLSFFEYALGYASGFGSVPLKVMGPANMLLLIFVGVISLNITKSIHSNYSSNYFIAPLSACAGCIWGISTYYIGRPVAQNLTAILPLLVTVIFIATSISNFSPLSLSSIFIRTIAIPVFFVVMIPLWSPSWITKAKNFKFFATNIENSIPVGQEEIEMHLTFLRERGEKNIIFYGNGDDAIAPNPYLTYTDEFNYGVWLPTPLQLLEAPIKQSRRLLYLTRYTCTHDFDSGSIIRKNTDPDLSARFSTLSNDINEKIFRTVETFSTDNYITTIFRKKISSAECAALKNY